MDMSPSQSVRKNIINIIMQVISPVLVYVHLKLEGPFFLRNCVG